MKFIRDYIEFRNRTQPIRDDADLCIAPDFMLGIFSPNRLDELKRYCTAHPQFHITSVLKCGVEVNAPVLTAAFY